MTTLKSWLAKATPHLVIVVVAVLLIPAIYGGLLIWSNQDPVHRLHEVPAAVVNDDVPATTGNATLNLGSVLVEQLLSDDAAENFAWRQLGEAEAATALAHGDVLVVLHIPASFSSRVASLGGDDPTRAMTAELTITTNDGANMIIGNVASSIGSVVKKALADEVRADYLNQIYLGFTTIHDTVSQAADGATKLSGGADTARDGAANLRIGLGALRDGTLSLSDGADSVSSGAHTLADGARNLEDGLSILNSNVAGLPDSAAQLDQGAHAAAAGASSFATATETLAGGAAGLAGGADAALAGAMTLHSGLGQLVGGTGTLVNGADSVSVGLVNLRDNYDILTDAQRKALIAQLAVGSMQVSQGAAATQTAASQLEAGAAALVGDTNAGNGLATLASKSHQLADGAANLHQAAGELSTGLDALAAGTSTLVTQIPTLTTAISQLADGGSQLATASSQLADGATTLTAGTTQIADGTAGALTGATTLDAGLGNLADGAADLATGLTQGTTKIPTYSDGEAAHLSSTAAAPVELATERLNEVPTYGYGLAAYFAAIALWVGAVAFYLVFDPISKRRLALGQPVWKVTLASMAPGVIASLLQGAALAWVITEGLHLQPANMSGFLLVIAASSVTFFAINQALVGLLGLPGRFLSLILLVLQVASAGGMYPVETLPPFLQTMHAWLPIGYTVTALRSLIAGGSIGLASIGPTLAGWLAASLVATTVAVLLQVKSREREVLHTPAPGTGAAVSLVAVRPQRVG